MNFSQIIGHDDVKKALSAMAESGRVPHAIMFYENDGCGALALADAFARELSGGANPDVKYSFPITTGTKVSGQAKDLVCDWFLQYWNELREKNPYFLEGELPEALGYEKKSGLITVAEADAILKRISLSSMGQGWRSFIVYLPEKMNDSTSNKLLKAIEEPSPGNIFMLITHSPEKVITTISSRCQGIRVSPQPKEEVSRVLVELFSVDPQKAEAAASIAGGSVGVALSLLSEDSASGTYQELFTSLMEALLSKDQLAALEVGEGIAALDSREKQKAFCIFASEGFRRIMLLQQGLQGIAAIPQDEKEFWEKCAKLCKKTFPRKALDIVTSAARSIDGNVNQRIIMCNMVNRLSVSI